MIFRLIQTGKRLNFSICHVAKPENGAQMCDADLKYDVIFGLNPQFMIKKMSFLCSKNITVIVRAKFFTGF